MGRRGSGHHATPKCSFGEELPCFKKMKDIGLELGGGEEGGRLARARYCLRASFSNTPWVRASSFEFEQSRRI